MCILFYLNDIIDGVNADILWYFLVFHAPVEEDLEEDDKEDRNEDKEENGELKPTSFDKWSLCFIPLPNICILWFIITLLIWAVTNCSKLTMIWLFILYD